MNGEQSIPINIGNPGKLFLLYIDTVSILYFLIHVCERAGMSAENVEL